MAAMYIWPWSRQAQYIRHFLLVSTISGRYQIHRQVVRGMATSAKRPHEEDNAGRKKPRSSSDHWSGGLKASMNDPNLRVKADDQCVIIKDKYPKARYHFLALPKRSISSLKKLVPNDIPLLSHMYEMSKEMVMGLDSGLQFRYGYHAVPSMSLLHLHVISQDFDSPCLKTKKHWNSFNTEYFIDSEDIIDMLNEEGVIQLNTSKYENLLKQDLKCHICLKVFPTMPALKNHLPSHIPKGAKKPS